MSPRNLKAFTELHTWTGLGAGLALFIAFYTGAITVFTHELHHWDGYKEAAVPVVQNYDDAQRLLDAVLASEPGATTNIRLYPATKEHPEHTVRWFKQLEDDSFEPHEFRYAENQTLNTTPDTAHLADFLYRLHFTAGLPAEFGIYVLGVVCLIYGVALLSGLIIFLPGFLRDAFVVRGGRNKKRFWLDAHNVVGVLSLPWHIMFAWSSALLAIGVIIMAPFQYWVFEEDLATKLGPELGAIALPEPSGKKAAMLSVGELVAIAKRQAPGLTVTQLRFNYPEDQEGSVIVRATAGKNSLDPNVAIALSTRSGEVLSVIHPESSSVGKTFFNGLVSLHFANFGNYITKWVYFILGLAGAFLFYSGNLLWVETRRKRREEVQPRATLFLARLNSGVCIGCMAGVSAAFLATRLFIEVPNRPDITEWAYFAVFFGSIAWSFLRPVAAGTRDLLYVAALLSALIPLSDAMLLNMPLWRSLAGGEWALVCVNLLAVMAAVSFWKMARAVQARAKDGEANSVWSDQAATADSTQVNILDSRKS